MTIPMNPMTLSPETTDDVEPRDVLAIEFDDPLLAQEALLAAKRLGRRGSLELADAALVARTEKGKTRLVQTRDTTPAQGAAKGFWWGGIAGLIAFGLVGWIAGLALGALAGAAYGRFRDIGIDDAWMRRLGDELTPGHTATVLQLPAFYATHLIRELRRFDGTLLHSSLADVDVEELNAALATTW